MIPSEPSLTNSPSCSALPPGDVLHSESTCGEMMTSSTTSIATLTDQAGSEVLCQERLKPIGLREQEPDKPKLSVLGKEPRSDQKQLMKQVQKESHFSDRRGLERVEQDAGRWNSVGKHNGILPHHLGYSYVASSASLGNNLGKSLVRKVKVMFWT
ncbi:unnamed protein product [Protopolystoma xenopodis]|uniref:Uncharacterized protein n=1 Tax=Protopolystoma xenopodis TaxID=117903 RepID=A0A3S5FDQ7_9PLAT|nr:unnamed protein product [Protopolystoma xenopodis]